MVSLAPIEELTNMDLVYERMALLDVRGVGINEQVSQLREFDQRITRTRVETWRGHPKYVDFKRKAIDLAFEDGKLNVKKMAVRLLPEAEKCLLSKLQEGDVKAAALVLSIYTGKDEDIQKQAQQLTVIMPGATETKTVNS